MTYDLMRAGSKAARPAFAAPSTSLPAAISGLGIRAEWPRAIQRLHGEPAVIQANGAGGQVGDVVALLGQFRASFDAFKAERTGFEEGTQTAIDEINSRLAALGLRPGEAADAAPVDPTYTKTFASWMRRGLGEQDLQAAHQTGERSLIRAAMDTGSPGQNGGYLAPVEWDRKILKALQSVSVLRNLCTVITTTTGGYSTIWNSGQWGTGWVGETASRPQTSNADLQPVIFKTGELYAQPAITQILLEDAAINIEQWLSNEVSDEFSRQETIAFVGGNGINKPQGFLSYFGTGTGLHPGGEPGVSMSGLANSITGDSLIDLIYSLAAPYRTGAVFVMNSTTLASLRKLKDGQGNYLWQPSLIAGQPQTLAGYPVAVEEAMPNVGAGNFPIAFGNWARFYVINDRLGTSVLRDPYTSKPFVLFYTRKRVGGGIQDPRAVRFLKVGVPA